MRCHHCLSLLSDTPVNSIGQATVVNTVTFAYATDRDFSDLPTAAMFKSKHVHPGILRGARVLLKRVFYRPRRPH